MKVYFVRANREKGLLEGLEKVLSGALSGIEDASCAVKVHFGERGSTRYIRPCFVRRCVDVVKKKGARCFITDTLALYRGGRGDWQSFFATAAMNGFSVETMGCPIVCADLSPSVAKIPKKPLRLSEVKVAGAITEADFLLSVSHFTFHPLVVPAGGIKNIGMGCVDKETKLAMHSSYKVSFDREKCVLCKRCIEICPSSALSLLNDRIEYDRNICIGCGECIAECKGSALQVPWKSRGAEDVQKGVIDGFSAVMEIFKEKALFINIALDITEHCDCLSRSEIPVVADVGIFVSKDGLSCDKAAFDYAMESPEYPGSFWCEKLDRKRDAFTLHPDTAERFFQLCRKAGIGYTEYEIEEV
jgi:hypothetical protein